MSTSTIDPRKGVAFNFKRPHGNLKYDKDKVKQWRALVSAGKKYPEISRLDDMHPHPVTICRKLAEDLSNLN